MTNDPRPEWAVRIQSEREARKWSKYELARQLMKVADLQQGTVENLARQVRDHENGRHFPREWAPAYAAAFTLTEAEIFGISDHSSPDQAPRSDLATVNVDGTGTLDDWEAMERRRLLLAALGLGATSLGSSSESVRQLLDLAIESEIRPIEDWQLTCVDQLHALRTQPPAKVQAALAIDLLALQRQLGTASSADKSDLYRVLASLSIFHANILTRLGNHGAAIHWWRTARRASDVSNDLEVRMMVRCEEAGFGLYGQRDLGTVLRLIENAQHLGGDSPSFWNADLAGIKAKTLSLLGRHDEAKRSLQTFVDWDGGDARAGIFPTLWSFDQPHFAESWIYAASGDEARSGEAREHVLARTPDYQYGANVQLHQAMCTVVNGGIDEGAQHATTVLDALPAPYRSQMITETARTVLRLTPVDQRHKPSVRELGQTLARTTPTFALTASTSSTV
ncbi:hypothetical protein ACGFNU_32740 [Spirillospora sp. NPDC048911]|uniref:hypothetical protein n=1 Tax=Spirillospora sp. NPDC048911 TaxID=3364527 RepID=UPI00371D761D